MISSVRTWLEDQGFPLEMRVAAAFQKFEFEVTQSSFYVDPESEKAREIDVIARAPDALGVIDIEFVVECKSSDKPWVLLCSPETVVGFSRIRAFGVLSAQARAALAERISDLIQQWPWLDKKGTVGYSLRQAHSGTDVAYAASMSVAKACDWILNSPSDYKPPYIFAFPVIVIDGPLVRCWLSAEGELELEEIDEGEFLFRTRFPHDFATCIRVVTLAGLERYLGEAKLVADKIRSGFADQEKRIFDAWSDARS